MGTESNDRREHLRDNTPAAPAWGEERYGSTPTPVGPPPVGDRPDPPDRSPPGPSLRGRHIAWARLERVVAAPATPPAPAPEPATEVTRPQPATSWSTPPPPPSPDRPIFDPGMPSALGRLVALIVTCGIGWALAVAIGVWLLVFVLTRAGG